MPYRILAKSTDGNTVTRMSLRKGEDQPTDAEEARRLSESFARLQGRKDSNWQARTQRYDTSQKNPLWDQNDGAVLSPVEKILKDKAKLRRS